MLPDVGHDGPQRMRRVLEWIVLAVAGADLNCTHFFTNRDERVAEAIELRFRLAFRRFDHQRARHRKAHRRCMEAVVDESLGDVFDFDARTGFERAWIDDALVRHSAVRALVQHRIVGLEA